MGRGDPKNGETRDDAIPQDVPGLGQYVTRRMDAIEEDLAIAIGAVQLVLERNAEEGDDEPPKATVGTSQVWICKGCRIKLALIDMETDEIRIRHRGQAVYVLPGYGGKVTIMCKTCGALNEITRMSSVQDEEPVEPATLIQKAYDKASAG